MLRPRPQPRRGARVAGRPDPAASQTRGYADGRPPLGGLLGQVGTSVSKPLSFDGLHKVRPQNIIQPSGQPVDVPDSATLTQSPGYVAPSKYVPFTGPSQTSYQGQRVNPGSPVGALPDVDRIAPGQSYQMRGGTAVDPSQLISGPQVGPGVDPSQTFSFDPESGQYFNAPGAQRGLPSSDDFQGMASGLEQATFDRGLNRIDPYLQEQRSALAQRLANQGLPVGSEAYEGELNRFDRSRGNALENLALSSVGAGRQEHSRLTGLAQSLRGQEFGENLASQRFNAGEAQRRFGERFGATQFNAGEAGRGFRESLASDQNRYGQDLSSRQFQAGEQGRGFGERLSSNQNLFGQDLASNQFNAGESARRFSELSRGQAQQYGINQRNRDFTAGEQARNFGQRMASEGQYFNQGLAGDQFAGNQAARRDALAASEAGRNFGERFQGQQSLFNQGLTRDQFNAGQGQQNFQNQFANQGLQGQNDRFLAGQQATQFNQDLAQRGLGSREMLQARQQPITDLSQILGLAGQVGQPGFQPTPQYGANPVNYAGLRQNQYQGDMNAYNRNQNNLYGLLGGLGGAALLG